MFAPSPGSDVGKQDSQAPERWGGRLEAMTYRRIRAEVRNLHSGRVIDDNFKPQRKADMIQVI